MTARKILLATLGIALFTCAWRSTADARPRPNGYIAGRNFEANKTFGLGLELGEPTGITGKYFLSADRALDFGVGEVIGYFDRTGFHVYGDYLFHPVSLVSNETFELPLYVGLGGRLWTFQDRAFNNNDVTAVGFRVPIGVSFDFNTVPLDAFVQVVPVLDLFSGYRAHTLYVDLDVSFGVRYWFN